MFGFTYTNTIPETKYGFMRFQRRYALRRALIMSAAFLIAVVLGVDMIIKNPTGFAGYILTALGLGMVISQMLRPKIIWDKLNKTLSGLNEEKYEVKFFDDRIEIETKILEEAEDAETEVVAITRRGIETVENKAIIKEVEDGEKSVQAERPEVSVIKLGTEELCAEENEGLFLLFVNRGLIYVFPKRCMDKEKVNNLREYLTEKAIL